MDAETKRFLAVYESGRHSIAEQIAALPERERRRLFARRSEAWAEQFVGSWCIWAREAQLPPKGAWRVWLMMAGRGFGKTRAGAEWIHHLAEEKGLRIALVGPTDEEVRGVMIEGASGLLACAPPGGRPAWEPSLGRITWPSGSRAFVYSGAAPERLRGPEHDHAWCDELAKWAGAETAWDNLMFGLRRGRYPRALVTTTPRPTPLMRRLRARGDVHMTRGRTADNVLLAKSFVDYVEGLYGGTRLGRQELEGVLVDDVEGSLWPRELIERCRVLPVLSGTGRGTAAEGGGGGGREPRTALTPLHHASHGPPPRPGEDLRRIVVGVDPPAGTGGDACGIVVVGLGADETGYVVEDASVAGLRPEGWARAVAAAAAGWGADRVVAEANQGGAMVESVLRSAEVHLPVKLVHASRGKVARAEPVATLFEAGRAKFAGAFPELEDELAGLTIGGGYEGPGRSPDRADAMVWAFAELMPAKKRADPRVVFL